MSVWTDLFEIALPGYLTGFGTLALATVTVKTLREAQTERRDRLDFEERESVRKVIIDEPKQSGSVESPLDRDFRQCDIICAVSNRSDEPIVNLTLTITAVSSEHLIDPVDNVRHADLTRLMPMTHGQAWNPAVTFNIRHPSESPVGYDTMPMRYEATLSFEDSAGYRWRRTADHQLRRISGPIAAERQSRSVLRLRRA